MNLEERVQELLGSKADQKWDRDFFVRYHEDFELSGIEKGQKVLEYLNRKQGSLDVARCAYFSVGGSTGSEIFHVLNNSNIRYGLLVEYDPCASNIAQGRADKIRKESKELIVITGDATQQLGRCKDHLLGWRESKKIDGLIVSAQAILHELPSRSPEFNLNHFIGEIVWDWNPFVLYSREPCSPSGWPNRVEIQIPGLTSTLLESLATDIQKSLNIGGKVRRAGPDFVSMTSALAVETITKIFYLDSYKHEIEEKVTSIKPIKFLSILEKYLGVNSTTLTMFSTDSFVDRYKDIGIIAKDSQGHQLPIPQVFSWIEAERIHKPHISSPTSPRPTKSSKIRWFTDFKYLSEPTMREGPFGFGGFTWGDLDPTNPNAKLVLRPDLVKHIVGSLECSGLHVILGKAASGKTALAHEVAYHLIQRNEGYVFYLDFLNFPKFDDKVRDELSQDMQLISSHRPTSYIVIDNAHVAINDVGDLIHSVFYSYPQVKVIVTMIPTFYRYHMILRGNPLVEALELDELLTVVRGSDITQQIVTNFLRRHEIPPEKVEDWGDSILIIGENLYELQLLLSAILEASNVKSVEINHADRDKNNMIKKLKDWEHYRREYVVRHLQSIRDKIGEEGVLVLATVAVWSQYDIGVERDFLSGKLDDKPGLHISEGLINYMVASGDVRDFWGFLRLPHTAIASTYVDTIRSTPAIEASLRQSISRKISRSGEFENNIFHAYLQYRPHSIDLISKQICNRGNLLAMISDEPQTIDAIVDMILVEADIKKKTEIFNNFEWLNRKLSEELMKRLLNSIDQLLEVFKRQTKIGPIIHFVAPMWYVSRDMPEKIGKTLIYDVDWEDISKPITLETMECQYMQSFNTLDQYRRTVLAKLDESSLSQETKDSYHALYFYNNDALIANTSACIKTFLYRRPLLCTKTPMADNKPGLKILQSLGDIFLTHLLDNESGVIDITYALSVISYFDQDLAKHVIGRMNLDDLATKLSMEEHLESAAYCAAVLCSTQPSLKDSFLRKLPDELANQLMSRGWVS